MMRGCQTASQEITASCAAWINLREPGDLVTMADVNIQELKRLPKEDIRLQHFPGRSFIEARLFEHPPGCRYSVKIPLSDLPNDLASIEDLERFGLLGLINIPAVT
jgi:hypothetical protein